MNLDGEPSDELSKSGVTVKFFRRFAKQYFSRGTYFRDPALVEGGICEVTVEPRSDADERGFGHRPRWGVVNPENYLRLLVGSSLFPIIEVRGFTPHLRQC